MNSEEQWEAILADAEHASGQIGEWLHDDFPDRVEEQLSVFAKPIRVLYASLAGMASGHNLISLDTMAKGSISFGFLLAAALKAAYAVGYEERRTKEPWWRRLV